MANEFVVKNGLISLGNISTSGSIFASNFSGSSHTGSLLGTSSWASNAVTTSYIAANNVSGNVASASYASSASYALSASNSTNSQTSSFLPTGTYQITASSAGSASYALTASFVSGSSNSSVSSSYSTSGSYTLSASNATNASTASYFTGSIIIVSNLTASLITGSMTGSLFGTSSFATTALNLLGSITSASYATTSSFSVSASYAPGSNSVSSSYSTSGSYVLSASNSTNSATASYFTGSTIVVTSLTASLMTGSLTGSLFGTASFATTALNLLGSITSASYSTSGSYVLSSSNSTMSQTSSYVTASIVISNTLTASISILSTNITSSNITASGQVLVGTASYNLINPEKFRVDYGTNSSLTIASFNSNLNNYSQIIIQNTSSGNTASADLVINSNSGSEASNYVDLGINNSQYSLVGNIGNANDSYLYSTASQFFIGNTTPTKNLYLFAGGSSNTSSFVLSASGNVGIGVTNPFNTLQVQGNISASSFTGSVTGSITGSLFGTSSFATTALNLLGTITSASFALTASYAVFASAVSGSIQSASYALSASYAPGGNSTATGNSITYAVNQTSHGFVTGSVIRISGSTGNVYTSSKADSATNAEVVGIVTTNTDANNFTYTAAGIITTGVPSGSIGQILYLDPVIAGGLTSIEPAAVGQVSKPLLYIISSSYSALLVNYRGMSIASSGRTYQGLTSSAVTTGNSAGSTSSLFSYSIPANTLQSPGDSIEFTAAGTFATSATLNKRILVVYGSTTILDTGALAITTLSSWGIKGTIMMTGSSAETSTVNINTSNSALTGNSSYTAPLEIVSNAINLVIDGEGTNSNDVVLNMVKISFNPA